MARTYFGGIRTFLVVLDKTWFGKKKLIRAEYEVLISGNNFSVRELKIEINELLDREAWTWDQKSRILWANP